jgi:hypothetical protein
MMHRFFLPAVAGLALALAVSTPAEAAGGGIGGSGLGGGRGMSLDGGGFGHAGLGGSLGGGLSGGLSHGGLGAGAGSFGHAGLGAGIGGVGTGGGAMSYGLGGGSRAPIGLGLTKGISSPGGDDLHLGLSSRELGLGNNFGLDAPDNVLSRAARVGNPPIVSGIGRQADDRPSLKGLNSEMTGDSQHSSQDAKGSQASGNGPKNDSFKKDKGQAERSDALQEQGQILLQQQLAAERQADLPPTPTPPSPAASTAAVPSPAAPTLPDVSPVVTTALGSGEVTMIGAYFAQHGAPVASVPTSSVNVSVGGTVPDNVALFPPPYDLVSQISDPDFSYFVWGQNVVIVDGQTNVVSAIVPDVLAHQD